MERALISCWRGVGVKRGAQVLASALSTVKSIALATALGTTLTVAPHHAAAQHYPIALQQEWQQEFSEFTQQNFRGLLAPSLSAAEQRKLGALRFEFPVGARPAHFDFHAVSDGRIVLPVESLLLLKDLAGASAWLSAKGHSVAPVFDYVSLLANRGLASWPVERRLPREALGVPADLGRDPAIIKRYEDLLLSSILYIVGHELGHLVHGIANPEPASPALQLAAMRQAAERKADGFALELFRRSQLAPVGAAFFFTLSSRSVSLNGLTGDEASWRKRIAASSHPLDGDRITAAADFMQAHHTDFERAFSKPATAAARVQALTAELRTLAGVVGRRETAVLQADCALTYQPDDLLPRTTTVFDLRPRSGENFAAGPWSGLHEGEIEASLNGQRTALRAILRRDGEHLSGETQHLCFRGRLEGRWVGTSAALAWTVGDSRRTLTLRLDAQGRGMGGRWQSLAVGGGAGSLRLQRIP